MRTASTSRRHGVVGALLLAFTIIMSALPDAGAQPLPGIEELPRVLIVARNDVPADALSAGPIAGALGGVILITPTNALSDPAHDALVAFDPDLVYIAGGTAAISAATEAAIDAAGPWGVERKAGPTRDHTAAELATVLTDLGVERPAVSGDPQIIGDVHLGGTVHANWLTVQSDDHVDNLNADLLDDLHANALNRVAAAASDDNLPMPGPANLGVLVDAATATIEAPTSGHLVVNGGVHAWRNTQTTLSCLVTVDSGAGSTTVPGSRRVVATSQVGGAGNFLGSCETSGVHSVDAGTHQVALLLLAGGGTTASHRSLSVQFVPFDGAGG